MTEQKKQPIKAILRDQKGWTKTLTIPYPMREIRLPLYRKLRQHWEIKDGAMEESVFAVSREKEMVIFELYGKGLNDSTFYYDEVIYGGAGSVSSSKDVDRNVSSPYDESQDGSIPSPAAQEREVM